jgi:hypothetical protein
MRDWALAYAARGLRIFPCRLDKLPVGHLAPHGFKNATSDPDQIRAWWSTGNYSIGCATGNGLMAVDVDMSDDAESGEAALRRLEARHGALPPSVEAITGSGGRHIYLTYPKHRDVRNSAGRLGTHIDVRAHGGYTILPPSRHESGRRYAWSIDSAKEFAAAPEWLLDMLDRRRPMPAPIAVKAEDTGSAPCPWAEIIENGIDEGGRDDGLTRLVGHYLPHHDPREVLQLTLLFNAHRCRPPLPDADVMRICNSIAAAELRKAVAL